MMGRFVILIAVLLAGPALAEDWRDAANAFDRDRLDNAPSTLAEALEEARAHGAAQDFVHVEGLLVPNRPIGGEELQGDWKCRTLKMGGLARLTVYSWFKCRISINEQGLYFEKLSGSQRTSGTLWPIYAEGKDFPVRYIYLGAGHYGDESPRPYGGPENTLGKSSDNRDEPAILMSIGPNHLRMGFPAPIFESKYDFLELRR